MSACAKRYTDIYERALTLFEHVTSLLFASVSPVPNKSLVWSMMLQRLTHMINGTAASSDIDFSGNNGKNLHVRDEDVERVLHSAAVLSGSEIDWDSMWSFVTP